MTNVAFEAFSCYEFEGASSWLVADVNIECDTEEHRSALTLAWVAIVMYPIGLIVLNGALLYTARHAIRSRSPTKLSLALAFLHSEYEPHLFWWS